MQLRRADAPPAGASEGVTAAGIAASGRWHHYRTLSDNPTNLILEYLRAIRGDIAEIKTDIVEMRERLGRLEANYANVSRRIDRMAGDIEQINHRLDLVEA